ncbi:ABC transporter permease [Microbacterium sp.]|uniref:ABC transporter permease n=1 Tax=Microbacterium sp. TaxID=51671 RepID=UPI0039E6EAB9
MEWLDVLLGSCIRTTTPILLAALAGLPTLWTRDINIGLDGIMIFGAFFGVAVGLWTGSIWAALAITIALAALAGLCFGVLVAGLKVDVFVAGIVLFVFAGAATAYLLTILFGVKGNLADPATPGLPAIIIPGLADVPLVGALLSGHSILTWLAVLLVAGLMIWDRRSVGVLYWRAAGSHPQALAASGVGVLRRRVLAQIWCFVFAALAGVQISLGQLSLFTVGMTGGVGFVALAVVIFSRGNVALVAVISVGFGLVTALGYQTTNDVVPHEITVLFPYAVALVALILLSRRSVRRTVAVRAA